MKYLVFVVFTALLYMNTQAQKASYSFHEIGHGKYSFAITNLSDSCLFFFDKQFEYLKIKRYNAFEVGIHYEHIAEDSSAVILDLSDSLTAEMMLNYKINQLLENNRWTSRCIEPNETVYFYFKLSRNAKNEEPDYLKVQINNSIVLLSQGKNKMIIE